MIRDAATFWYCFGRLPDHRKRMVGELAARGRVEWSLQRDFLGDHFGVEVVSRGSVISAVLIIEASPLLRELSDQVLTMIAVLDS